MKNNILTHTSLGTPITMSASHSLEELKSLRPILWLGGIHGDEPEGVELAKKTQQWLESHCSAFNRLSHFDSSNCLTNTGSKVTGANDSGGVTITAAASSSNYLELVPWLVIPCLNPDGFAKNQRVNGRGVDLNRNYPTRDWSPEAKAERYFPGPNPASEIEIQKLCELIHLVQPRLIVHCHSWTPCIVATGAPAMKDANVLAHSSQYTVQETIGYDTPGSLSAYGWHDNQIPVICIEETEGIDLGTVWPRFSAAIEKIFRDQSPRTL